MPENKIELHRIDIRALPPTQWEEVMREAARQARKERSLVCRSLLMQAWRFIQSGVRIRRPGHSFERPL